jgi:phosphatidate cytidylyltransferase
MTRLLSGAALVAFAILVVWFAPGVLLLVVGETLLLLAFVEYVTLAQASGFSVPPVVAGLATALTCAAIAGQSQGSQVSKLSFVALDTVLMSSLVGLGALALSRWRGGPGALGHAAASLFPALYLGLPIGALVAIRETRGREALFLLMLTVIVSDTAQYYTGRLFGRRLLAPAISPKKTIAGAVGGFVFGTVLLAAVGRWWLPTVPLPMRAALGAMVVALGIAGDLFESMLKRSAGVKDSSSLIPGHGGVLDRIDALLFTAPVYYIVLKYV